MAVLARRAIFRRLRYNVIVELVVTQTRGHSGVLECGSASYPCALGKGGVSARKREGDGATPTGVFTLRRVFYRADKIARPQTALPIAAIGAGDGWCDYPEDPLYNRQVKLPYKARAERLWHGDDLYDVVVVLGYNDEPVVTGRGSAIFLHVASADMGATEGCVALKLPDLVEILRQVRAGDSLRVTAAKD